jgi:hypothetical protein
VSCESLIQYFSRVQHFKELVIFADCCRTAEKDARQTFPPWTESDTNRGGVRKFFGVGAQFFYKSYERVEGDPLQQRGYFTRALLDGLKGGALPPASSPPVKSTDLKHYIEEHMLRNSQAKFPRPLQPDFADLGNREVLFGPKPDRLTKAATLLAAELGRSRTTAVEDSTPFVEPQYIVRIRLNSFSAVGLEISTGKPGAAPIVAKRVSGQNVFECKLPIGVFEAVPLIGEPPTPQPQAEPTRWMFNVTEAGGEICLPTE